MENLLEHERTAGGVPSVSPDVRINIEGKTEDNLLTSNVDNLLLAEGDSNRNPTGKLSKDLSAAFIQQESSKTDAQGTAKRKRNNSSESLSNAEEVEEEEESVASGLESDIEDNDSDLDTKITILPTSLLAYDTSIDKNLPDTVTLLTTPAGAKVYLIGTAHFSLESQEDVSKIIRAVQPHIVLVELCRARVNILQLDEKTILEEAKNINFEKIRSTIKQNGLFHGLMYILLLSMSAHLTKQLGMAPGGEFRRAFAEVQKVPNCMLHMGDRPIHITLQRALAALSWWQTIRLTWHLLTSKEPISKEEVERCKQRDLLEEMLAEMTGEFPALSTVFVNERDIYLTNSLQLAADQLQPTPTGIMPSRVVGVVGIGHVPGIVQNWGKVSKEDIPPIMRIPPPTLTSRVLKFTVKASAVGLFIWGCSRFVPVPGLNSIKASFQNLTK